MPIDAKLLQRWLNFGPHMWNPLATAQWTKALDRLVWNAPGWYKASSISIEKQVLPVLTRVAMMWQVRRRRCPTKK